jgi:hypothetical protein
LSNLLSEKVFSFSFKLDSIDTLSDEETGSEIDKLSELSITLLQLAVSGFSLAVSFESNETLSESIDSKIKF